MRPSIVFVDFESVQPASVDLLAADHFRLKIFVGATQRKLTDDEVSAVIDLLQGPGHLSITTGKVSYADAGSCN